jgi:AcrR family transcriptional regulator
VSADRALSAAVDAIEATGWPGFKLGSVGRAAGVSIGLLTSRFGSKEDLFHAAQQLSLQRLREDCDALFAAPDPDGRSAAESIDAALVATARIVERHGRLLNGLTIALPPDTPIAQTGQVCAHLLSERFARALLPHAGELAHDDPALAVDVCFRVLHAALERRILYGPRFESNRDIPWSALLAQEAAAARAYLLAPRVTPTQARVTFSTQDTTFPHAPGATDPTSRILAAGIDLLAEDAMQEPTIAAVAHRAGVSVGTVYNHYASKDALFLALNDHAQTNLEVELNKAFDLDIDATLGPDDVVASAVRTLAAHSTAHPEFLRATVLRAMRDQRVADRGSQTVVALGERFCQTVLMRRSAIRRPDPDAAADVCFRLAFSALVRDIAMGDGFDSARPLPRPVLLEELCVLARSYLLDAEA